MDQLVDEAQPAGQDSLKHLICQELAADNKLSTPLQTLGGGISGRGSLPEEFLTWPKIVARPVQLQKNIALAFLKVTWLQISYWVHFTFEI